MHAETPGFCKNMYLFLQINMVEEVHHHTVSIILGILGNLERFSGRKFDR